MIRRGQAAYRAAGMGLTVLLILHSDRFLTQVSGSEAKPKSDVPMTRPEECLAVVDGIGRHAGFVELPDGKIMVLQGNKYSLSADGGISWTAAAELRDSAGKPLTVSDGSLIRLKGGSLGLTGIVFTSREYRRADIYHIAFWRSDDGGKTWSGPVRVSEPSRHTTGCLALHDSLIRTSSGRIVLPVASGVRHARDPLLWTPQMSMGLRDNQLISVGAHDWPQDGFGWCYVYYSDDEGRTWKSSHGGDIFIRDDKRRMWEMATEPTVAEVEPGKILMLVRSNLGRLYKSWSLDNGETWTAPTSTSLAASNAPAQLRKIPGTGDLLVVWNQAGEEEIKKGLKRARLSSAVSRTNGALWESFQNVESALEGTRVEPGPIFYTVPEEVSYGPTAPAPEREARYITDLPHSIGRLSYPAVFFYRDRVLIAHSNQHFSDAEGKLVTPGRLRVLPISWLYGGAKNMKPNPELRSRFPIEFPK